MRSAQFSILESYIAQAEHIDCKFDVELDTPARPSSIQERFVLNTKGFKDELWLRNSAVSLARRSLGERLG
jgi:hypothetical protein